MEKVQAELNSLALTNFERAQIVAVEKNIQTTISDLQKYGDKWAQQSLTKSAHNGVASTIYSLGLAETFEDALKIARFNSLNKPLVEAVIADTQSDLLAVTQNVSRKTRAAVRQATADVLRAKVSTGINGTQSLQQALTKEIRKKLGSAADSAIVDSLGRKWKLKNYTEMLARTKMMEAHKEATRNEALSEGVEYAVISSHGAKDDCMRWENRIIALSPDAPGDYPYVDDLPNNEIFHPNCRHIYTAVRDPNRLPDNIREMNNVVPDEPGRELASYDLQNAKILEGDNVLAKAYDNRKAEGAENYIGNQANRALKGEHENVKQKLLESRYLWVDDSSSAYGKAIENHFSEAYKLPYKQKTNEKLSDVEKAVLDYDHADVVKRLKKGGQTHIKVYRGVSWSDEDNWLPKDLDDMTLKNRGLTSWTVKPRVAEAYADYVDDDFWKLKHTKAGVMEALVPIDNIAFVAIIGDTDEVVVIGDIKGAKMLQTKEANKSWRKRK